MVDGLFPVQSLVEAGVSADYVIADKAYDAAGIRAFVTANHSCPVIPQRRGAVGENPNYDPVLFKSRHVIENLFAKMKQWRAVATRYEKTAANFLAVVQIASAFLWLT